MLACSGDAHNHARGQTVVPPYVARPVRGASVSTPLRWEELVDGLHPTQFTLQTMPPRLARVGDLFRPALENGQNLMPAIEALQARLRR